VVNAGVDGWTSYELLIDFAFRIQDIDPDLLIILCGMNDSYARIVWPPEAFKGDNSGFRAPLFDNVVMPSVLESSTLLRVVLIKLGLAESHFALRTLYDKTAAGSFYGFEWERQQAAGVYPQGIFKEVRLEQMLAANGTQYFTRNLENIIALAGHHGIRVLLASEPYQEPKTITGEDRPTIASPAFVKALKEAEQAMSALARKAGATWFNLEEAFPKEARYDVDGIHVNREGASMKAKLFADFIIENNLVPGVAGIAAKGE
jgi:lysophospholipase L1-like esterase